MLFLGVDPGVSGGLAVLDEHGRVIATHKMPDTGRDTLDLLHQLTLHTPETFTGQVGDVRLPARAVIEKVNPGVFGKPGQRMGVVSAFTFGRNVERLHMALLAAGIPFDEVLPVKWQTALTCRTGGDKNVSKRRAQQLFPSVKVTHAIADALLLAEFCRRTQMIDSDGGTAISGSATGGLFDGEEKEDGEKTIHVPEGFYTNREDAQRAEANAQRRGARAHVRRDPQASTAAAATRHRRGSGLEAHRRRRV